MTIENDIGSLERTLNALGRLARGDLVNTLDPKLIAATMGLDPPNTANGRYGQWDPWTAP
ncbi:hypothetical protein [Actinoplanes missouriensis]|uniref:hypothetical protein n=1 Tax=Actinoplanes missouriensis TaxID=1866 RepID=UPI0002D861A8|nr:hypothetical protein [Actinoplanes missouriensis]